MFNFKSVILFLLISFLNFQIYSQTKNESEIQVYLYDTTIFSGKIVLKDIELKTDFGKLSIPASKISIIEFGLTYEPANESKIITQINLLKSDSEEKRKKAYEDYLNFGIGAILVSEKYIESENYIESEYMDYRIDNAIAELRTLHNVPDIISDKDTITTVNEEVVKGKFDFTKLDLKTEFGILNIPREKISRISILYHGDQQGTQEKIITLLAAKHISSNTTSGWFNTGIKLRKGQRFSIKASGEIIFASLSNNKYRPNGAVNSGAGYSIVNGSSSSTLQYGNVVFKIGPSGEILKSGESFQGIAKENGILYLSIYETVYNSANTGKYTVKILLN